MARSARKDGSDPWHHAIVRLTEDSESSWARVFALHLTAGATAPPTSSSSPSYRAARRGILFGTTHRVVPIPLRGTEAYLPHPREHLLTYHGVLALPPRGAVSSCRLSPTRARASRPRALCPPAPLRPSPRTHCSPPPVPTRSSLRRPGPRPPPATPLRTKRTASAFCSGVKKRRFPFDMWTSWRYAPSGVHFPEGR